ncbi:MAG: exodeoxyribonuclease VII large subunit [Candidatus Eremiobacteraeota bacterium]|nr:exodeoxyribonuclease VII large subunit [Candidatus Eremiobacteraeota bacterium]
MNEMINHGKKNVWTISSLTGYIKNLLTGDPALHNVRVKGEISGFKRAYSGHCYFTLKDSGAVLKCVMFRSKAQNVNFDIKEGQNVLAFGNITLYEKGGNYQLIIETLKPEGMGDLYLKFLQLKENLKKKGYFNPERKKSIPFIPRGIGVATSSKGAALQDIITTITSRFPDAKIYISPTSVQGTQAPASIVNSIKLLDNFDPVDVIIISRGGGSFEDLNCFNDERVANAIHNCRKPIISGVGHETDFTISDMTADLRAATPTAAAQAVVPRYRDLETDLSRKKSRLLQNLQAIVERKREYLDYLRPGKLYMYLENLLNRRRQDLDRVIDNLSRNIKNRMERLSGQLELAGEKLNALNPFRVLERGYTIIKDKDTGSFITRAEKTRIDQDLQIIFNDGDVVAKVYLKGKTQDLMNN